MTKATSDNADAEAIDQVLKLGMNHPMGPLKLADLIGLDICLDVMEGARRQLQGSKVSPLPPVETDDRRRLAGKEVGQGIL